MRYCITIEDKWGQPIYGLWGQDSCIEYKVLTKEYDNVLKLLEEEKIDY
jgi:hypothetical protein